MVRSPLSRKQLTSLPEWFLSIARKIENANYQYEIWGMKKQADHVSYQSYSLAPSPSEVLLTEFFDRASPDETFYDVGANIGHYSLAAAAEGYPVYAFEPSSEIVKKLVKNIQLNNYNDLIKVFNIGLAEQADTLTFYHSSHPGRGSFNKFNAAYGDAKITDTQNVTVTTIDTLVESHSLKPPDHIKVDVEGFELNVLQGAKQTLREYNPTIYLEPHETDTDENQINQLRSFLEDMQYDILEFDYPWVCVPSLS